MRGAFSQNERKTRRGDRQIEKRLKEESARRARPRVRREEEGKDYRRGEEVDGAGAEGVREDSASDERSPRDERKRDQNLRRMRAQQ